ncbi:hypothetical protein PENSPDRAFT_760267 [Peniophora sp. CONT]|nr:hypothetical protein PENSPDRAFT_760267 [Peniophora sp. CONT]
MAPSPQDDMTTASDNKSGGEVPVECRGWALIRAYCIADRAPLYPKIGQLTSLDIATRKAVTDDLTKLGLPDEWLSLLRKETAGNYGRALPGTYEVLTKSIVALNDLPIKRSIQALVDLSARQQSAQKLSAVALFFLTRDSDGVLMNPLTLGEDVCPLAIAVDPRTANRVLQEHATELFKLRRANCDGIRKEFQPTSAPSSTMTTTMAPMIPAATSERPSGVRDVQRLLRQLNESEAFRSILSQGQQQSSLSVGAELARQHELEEQLDKTTRQLRDVQGELGRQRQMADSAKREYQSSLQRVEGELRHVEARLEESETAKRGLENKLKRQGEELEESKRTIKKIKECVI